MGREEGLPQLERLPLWACVLLATRAVQRGAMTLSEAERAPVLRACDALVDATTNGTLARECDPPADASPAALALAAAIDAARAAEASLDFAAAETACVASVDRALAHAADLAATPLQAAIVVAADLDLLSFATAEFGIGRYDVLTRDVLARLTPVR